MSENNNISPQNKLVVFQNKEISRAWYNDEWYYSLVDIVAVLSESKNPTDYLKKIRKRDEELKNYIGTNCPQVEMQNKSGKKRKILSGNTKDVFRLIQSIPSKKAEPFNTVGYDGLQTSLKEVVNFPEPMKNQKK